MPSPSRTVAPVRRSVADPSRAGRKAANTECPHCHRKFSSAVASRHIPKCRSIRAKPQSIRRTSEVGSTSVHHLVQQNARSRQKHTHHTQDNFRKRGSLGFSRPRSARDIYPSHSKAARPSTETARAGRPNRSEKHQYGRTLGADEFLASVGLDNSDTLFSESSRIPWNADVERNDVMTEEMSQLAKELADLDAILDSKARGRLH